MLPEHLALLLASTSIFPLIAYAPEKGSGSGGSNDADNKGGQGSGDQSGDDDGADGGGGGDDAGAGDQGDGAGADGKGAGEGEGTEGTGDKKAGATEQRDWRDREINRKHRQLKQKETELEEIRRERDELRALAQKVGAGSGAGADKGGDKGDQGDPKRSQFSSEAEFNAAVEAVVQKRETARMLAQVSERGVKDYGEEAFSRTLDRLQELGGFTPEDMTFLLLGTDDPARVMHELGTKPETYQKLMDMTPERRKAEFVKIASAPKPKKAVSDAPPPIDPIRGGAGAQDDDIYDDKKKMTDEQWYAARQKQKRNSTGRPWSVAQK